MTPNEKSCKICPLSKETDTSGFDCGDADLNDFLQSDALKNQDEWFSVTKVLMLDGRLAGYFTIIADTLHKGRIAVSDKIADYPYQKYPAVKLARLAVDKQYQHQGIGSILMDEFFDAARISVDNEGGRFITVDALSSARGFYEQYGFCPVSSQKDAEVIPMYLDFRKFYMISKEIYNKSSAQNR